MIIKQNIQKAKTEHMMPARLNKKKLYKGLKIAKKAHRILRCRVSND